MKISPVWNGCKTRDFISYRVLVVNRRLMKHSYADEKCAIKMTRTPPPPPPPPSPPVVLVLPPPQRPLVKRRSSISAKPPRAGGKVDASVIDSRGQGTPRFRPSPSLKRRHYVTSWNNHGLNGSPFHMYTRTDNHDSLQLIVILHVFDNKSQTMHNQSYRSLVWKVSRNLR